MHHNHKPHHKKMSIACVNHKGEDQPAHPLSLTSAFVVRWLDTLITLTLASQNHASEGLVRNPQELPIYVA